MATVVRIAIVVEVAPEVAVEVIPTSASRGSTVVDAVAAAQAVVVLQHNITKCSSSVSMSSKGISSSDSNDTVGVATVVAAAIVVEVAVEAVASVVQCISSRSSCDSKDTVEVATVVAVAIVVVEGRSSFGGSSRNSCTSSSCTTV